MSDEPKDYLSVEGALFSIEFYFMCEHGHMHTAQAKFEGLRPQALTEEALTKMRDDIMAMEDKPGHQMRPATAAEIERYMMEENFAADVEAGNEPKADQKYFMVAGPKEPQ